MPKIGDEFLANEESPENNDPRGKIRRLAWMAAESGHEMVHGNNIPFDEELSEAVKKIVEFVKRQVVGDDYLLEYHSDNLRIRYNKNKDLLSISLGEEQGLVPYFKGLDGKYSFDGKIKDPAASKELVLATCANFNLSNREEGDVIEAAPALAPQNRRQDSNFVTIEQVNHFISTKIQENQRLLNGAKDGAVAVASGVLPLTFRKTKTFFGIFQSKKKEEISIEYKAENGSQITIFAQGRGEEYSVNKVQISDVGNISTYNVGENDGEMFKIISEFRTRGASSSASLQEASGEAKSTPARL